MSEQRAGGKWGRGGGDRGKSSGNEEKDWGQIWFKKLAQFHRVADSSEWCFSVEQVIVFLQSMRDCQVPAWKRLRAVEGLMQYRNQKWGRGGPELEPVRNKLREIVFREEQAIKYEDAEGVVGKINPREADVIQEFRRKLRLQGNALNTEKAYVQKVKAFMLERGLRTLADFENIGAADVESHLTDLAVDGNVAPSTQNQAFYALLKLFELVLQRDLGEINALRSTKEHNSHNRRSR